jgi:hypothetical protein
MLAASLLKRTYSEGDQTLEPLFAVDEAVAEEEPVPLPVTFELELDLVNEASRLAIELLAAAAASAEDSATKAWENVAFP